MGCSEAVSLASTHPRDDGGIPCAPQAVATKMFPDTAKCPVGTKASGRGRGQEGPWWQPLVSGRRWGTLQGIGGCAANQQRGQNGFSAAEERAQATRDLQGPQGLAEAGGQDPAQAKPALKSGKPRVPPAGLALPRRGPSLSFCFRLLLCPPAFIPPPRVFLPKEKLRPSLLGKPWEGLTGALLTWAGVTAGPEPPAGAGRERAAWLRC